MKIFLLEDDYSLNETIKEMLEINNHKITSFYDGEVAYKNIFNNYDLYILDINIPSLNGLEILKSIKNMSTKTKVIMISANINIETIKEAYALGCDDYLKKPFDVEELILKVEKLNKKDTNVFLDENIYFNLISNELYIDSKKVELTKREKDLLILLLDNKGKTISYENIENFVYQGESKSSDAIRSLLKRLRKKLPKDLILNSIEEGYFIK
ncbi:MAG: response regulator transcription factor [Arcobacteraceae bacterium]